MALGLTVPELALRAGVASDEIEYIEEGGTEPTFALLRTLAAALGADVRLTTGHDLASMRFETHATLSIPGQLASDLRRARSVWPSACPLRRQNRDDRSSQAAVTTLSCRWIQDPPSPVTQS